VDLDGLEAEFHYNLIDGKNGKTETVLTHSAYGELSMNITPERHIVHYTWKDHVIAGWVAVEQTHTETRTFSTPEEALAATPDDLINWDKGYWDHALADFWAGLGSDCITCGRRARRANVVPPLAGGATKKAPPFREKNQLIGGGFPADAVGGTIIPAQNSPYIVVRKGNKIFHIDQHRVKEYIDNPMKPEGAHRGDKVNFQTKGLPVGSTRITGEKSGNGHKRTPTPGELEMYNNYFNKNK
jgi:hypothetical protein